MTKAENQGTCDATESPSDAVPLTPELLVEEHAGAVLGFCVAHTKNLHDAEDAMQDVFLKATAKFHTLRDPAHARPWLLQIAKRTCIDRHRKRLVPYPTAKDLHGLRGSVSEEIARLHGALLKLPEHYRETISLYYLGGRTCASVAQGLGITEIAVRTRLVRARLMLHDLLVEDEQ